MFVQTNNKPSEADFKFKRTDIQQDEVQIYTWKDASLEELTGLIKGICPQANHRTARIHFGFVYPNKLGENVIRWVGQTFGSRKSLDDSKTLEMLGFEIGDYLSVSVTCKQ